jgi:hypothetical protein
MRKALVLLLGVCLLALFVGSVSARDIDRSGTRAIKDVADDENPALIDQGLQTLMATAAVDTFCIVWFDFEQMDWQGWTSIDNTAQVDTFFHVDDFAGVIPVGGDFGRLVPLEGTKSLWCGTPAGLSFYLCSWLNAPGYGNNWNQIVYSDAIPFTGILTWSFVATFDSEPDWDITYLEYDAGDDNWVEVEQYDDVLADTVVVQQLLLSQAATKLRFHFIADGAWSDQDGLYDTDGAVIIDSITVQDAGGVIDYEDFESYSVGNSGDLGIWHCTIEDAFGAYAGLANNLVDKDPCGDNFGTQIIFFQGSAYPSADYPGLFDTPFCTGPGGIASPCQDESVLSPVIDMMTYSLACDKNQDTPIPAGDAASLGGAVLRFVTYRDIPLTNLVFYTWSVRSIGEEIPGCPGQWRDRNFVYYGGDKDYINAGQDISDLVGPLPMQVTVGVSDMCDGWYGVYGDCAAHTPSPWLDNVRIYRYKTVGPSWSVRSLDLFQDTFPQEVEISTNPMEEYCRADGANDIAPGDDFVRIDPGDSAVVTCAAPLAGGLDTLVTGEAKVYCHVNVTFLGLDGKPDLTGVQLEGTYGTWQSTDGNGWDILLCVPAETSAGNAAPDKYAIDLNDSLFTRGYMVEYYFKAYDRFGDASTYPASAEQADGNRHEFTCLPTLRAIPGVLYCDDFENRGTFIGTPQTYFDPAFQAVTPTGEALPDRYDTNGPSSGVSNGVGAYTSVTDASSIFCYAYEKVIHDSGDLNSVTITEGTEDSDKSNDAQLLVDWMNVSEHKVGLLVMGDQVAYDLSNSASAVALELVSTICGVTLENSSYYDMTGGREAGGVVTPLITGVTGGPYDGLSYYAYGGCFIINDFDVLETTGPGQYALSYPDYNSLQYYAGIFTDQLNNASQNLRTVWVGHSFMLIRDAVQGTLARNTFLALTYNLFENGVSEDYTDAELPKAYSLKQNFPNPFNPSTRIQFALPTKGHVSLKIYNVAGQLVKTLQNGVMDAGSHELTWDGSNNLGSNVASGVYFYKINAGDDYENMKKMVLLR